MTPEQPTITPRVSQAEINNILWRACDTLRGTVDPTQYKDYILTLLFVKYLSDVWKDHHAAYLTKYQGDEARAARAMQLERFQVPEHCAFDYLYKQRNADNIGELINIALDDLETANRGKLTDVFRNIDFNSEPNLGRTRERNTRLKLLLQDFADTRLDLRPSVVGGEDVIGNAYEYLISRFAADAGKGGGRVLHPWRGSRAAGPPYSIPSLVPASATLLAAQAPCSSRWPAKWARAMWPFMGQEINGSTYALCSMNMFLHGLDDAQIEWGDTLRNPRLLDGENLRRYDVVAANPPFSLDKWGHDEAGLDRHGRFYRGLPPKSKGDYAFILHMIETTLDGHGQAGVIVPHGVLFRGGTEGKIRQRLIEENLLDAVIGLPGNLFFGTGIPAAILLFRRGRTTGDVLFIDASRDFDAGKNQNRLGEIHIARVVDAYRRYETEERFAQRVTPGQLLENDYSLNIPRYVDTQEAETAISLVDTQREITRLEGELAAVRGQVHTYLRELGINVEA